MDQMWIELHESGGIANRSRQVVLRDGHVLARERGTVQVDRPLEEDESQTVARLTQQLLQAPLRHFYGRHPVSDAKTLSLSIELDSGAKANVEVVTDPSDSPPQGLWELVRAIHQLHALLGLPHSKKRLNTLFVPPWRCRSVCGEKSSICLQESVKSLDNGPRRSEEIQTLQGTHVGNRGTNLRILPQRP